MKKKQLSIYVHIPFCARKCLYCDFLSAPASECDMQAYVQALLAEISQKAAVYQDFYISSVFIGGGTPSILPSADIGAVMLRLRNCYAIDKDAEITIEVNPGTATRDKLAAYRQAGIHRISIGLQSVQDKELMDIGRIHTFEDFLETYEMARAVGYRNINIDLMSALPGQTLETYRATLEQAVKLHPEHISAYSLIIEEGTPIYARYGEGAASDFPPLPDENTERGMYELTNTILGEAGYARYEISNYALPGMACKHNTGYWKRANYLGFGLGSASLVENERWNNTSELTKYLKRQFGKKNRELLKPEEQMEEFMFLGLRLMQGVSVNKFAECFGMEIDSVYGKIVPELQQQGLLEETADGYIRLTNRGIDISNYVMSEFIF